MAEGEDVLAKMGQNLIKESYGDLVKPTAKDIGEALSGIFKAITFYPRYWAMTSDISLEEKVARFKKNLAEKVEEIPTEFRVLPPPSILGPSVQALEYAVIEDDISDMFSSLIASSMNSSMPGSAHPAFVEIIKQLTSDEAKIMRFLFEVQSKVHVSVHKPIVDVVIRNKISSNRKIYLRNQSFIPEESGCKNIESGSNHIGNLCRLALLEIPHGIRGTDDSLYDRINSWFSEIAQNITLSENEELEFEKKLIRMTPFGIKFAEACIKYLKESHQE